MPSARSGYAIVAVLLIFAGGAFLRAEQLKLKLSPIANPNPVHQTFDPSCTATTGCGRATLFFKLRSAQKLQLSIVNSSSDVVKAFPQSGKPHPKGRVKTVWDGTTNGGKVAPDGPYRLRVKLESAGKTITIPNRIVVDTVAPTLTITSKPGAVPVTYTAKGNPKVFLALHAPSGKGHLLRGHGGTVRVPQALAVPGTTMTLIAVDAAGNKSAPVQNGTIS